MTVPDSECWHPFRRLSGYLVEHFGEKVHKVSLHCGFSCPNRDGTKGTGGCAFCLDEALEPVGYAAEQSIAEQLEQGMAYVRRRHRCRRFIAYYQDHSATYASCEKLAEVLRPALTAPEVVGLAVSTRPDCLASEVIELLQSVARHKDLWVELGLQIADDALLSDLNRLHTVADFATAAASLHGHGLRVCAHVIIGLPRATSDLELRTAELLAELECGGSSCTPSTCWREPRWRAATTPEGSSFSAGTSTASGSSISWSGCRRPP